MNDSASFNDAVPAKIQKTSNNKSFSNARALDDGCSAVRNCKETDSNIVCDSERRNVENELKLVIEENEKLRKQLFVSIKHHTESESKLSEALISLQRNTSERLITADMILERKLEELEIKETSLKGFSKQFQNLHEEISNKTGIIEDKSVIIAKLCNVIHQMGDFDVDDDESLRCSFCDKEIKTPNLLRWHINIVHDLK